MADHFPFSTDDYPANQGTEITPEQFKWASDMAFRAGQSIASLALTEIGRRLEHESINATVRKVLDEYESVSANGLQWYVVYCDRCRKRLMVNDGTGMTAGYYNTSAGYWATMANPGENYVCDDCICGQTRDT